MDISFSRLFERFYKIEFKNEKDAIRYRQVLGYNLDKEFLELKWTIFLNLIKFKIKYKFYANEELLLKS